MARVSTRKRVSNPDIHFGLMALWDVGGAKHHDGLESRINDFRVHCTMLAAGKESCKLLDCFVPICEYVGRSEGQIWNQYRRRQNQR
jgi:hypothetical protein